MKRYIRLPIIIALILILGGSSAWATSMRRPASDYLYYYGSTSIFRVGGGATPFTRVFDDIEAYYGTDDDYNIRFNSATDKLVITGDTVSIGGTLEVSSILSVTGNLTIGSGEAGIDYVLTFDGETNDGAITWMEDEDRFDISCDVQIIDGGLDMGGNLIINPGNLSVTDASGGEFGINGGDVTTKLGTSDALSSFIITDSNSNGIFTVLGNGHATGISFEATEASDDAIWARNGGFTTGQNGADGKVTLYSEQGGTDYSVTLNPNASMTSTADFFFPADEPAATYLLNMTAVGVIGFDTNNYLKEVITDSGIVSVAVNGITIEGAGIATTSGAGDTVTITVTEADTLTSITGRGASTATLSTFTGGLTLGADDDTSNMILHSASTIQMYDDSDDTSVTIGPVTDGTTTLGVTGTIQATSFSGPLTGNVTGNADTCTTASAGDSATAFFSSGSIEHEYGGLEADVNAYNGLIRIASGSTTNVTNLSGLNTALGSSIADGAHISNYLADDASDITTGTLTADSFELGNGDYIGIDGSNERLNFATAGNINANGANFRIGETATDNVVPDFQIIADADSDGGQTTSETFQWKLTADSDPTMAVWHATQTQGSGYQFDAFVTATGFNGNLTGNADTVTTNANLTGPITSSGNATTIAAQTGSGTTFVVQDTPTLTTPEIGAATGTSLALTTGNLDMGSATVDAGDFTLQMGGQTNDGKTTLACSSDANADFSVTTTEGDIRFDAIGGTVEITILETGLIGINQPSPLYPLSVNGNSNQDLEFLLHLRKPVGPGGTVGILLGCGGAGSTGTAALVQEHIDGWQDGDVHILNRAAGNDNLMPTLAHKQLTVSQDGEIYLWNIDGAALGGNVVAAHYDTVTKELFYDSSSARYKSNIKPGQAPEFLYDLEYRTFEPKDRPGVKGHGFIAEEVIQVAPDFVATRDGLPESVNYSMMIAPMIHEMQSMRKELDHQKIINSIASALFVILFAVAFRKKKAH